MNYNGRGRVSRGAVVLDEPVPLPEGTEVIVHIEAERTGTPPASSAAGFEELPFFGMWADRADLGDGPDRVRQERQRWHQRTSRPD